MNLCLFPTANRFTFPLHCAALCLSLLTVSLRAAAPTLDYLLPAGGQRGTTNAVTMGGKFEHWPVEVWTDSPGVVFKAGKNKGEFSAEIAKDAAVGPRLVRLYNADGASAVRWFVVGDLPEIAEQEPNNGFKEAQAVAKMPVTINGRLDKTGDVDSFAVQLEAGKYFVASVDAYSLGSPMDAYLFLLNERGTKVAFGNDSRNLDPLLTYQVEKSGTYYLQIMAFAHPPTAEVQFAGGNTAVYRLTMTTGAYARYTWPLAVQRGQNVSAKLFGWNLEAGEKDISLNASALNAGVSELDFKWPEAANHLFIPVTNRPEELEKEPNNKSAEAQALTLPCAITGRIDPAGDEDRFSFKAVKGKRYSFRIRSAGLGFPLTAMIKVESTEGRQLARSDDNGDDLDPKLMWNASSDGNYVVAISDLTHAGGKDYVYRLEASEAAPDFQATVDSHAFRLESGKTVEIKLKIEQQNKYKGKMLIRVKGLPAGVSAQEVETAEEVDDAKVTLTATPEAPLSNQPIQIEVTGKRDDSPLIHTATYSLIGESPRGDLLINQTDQLWLTVGPDVETSAKTEKKKKK